MKARRPRLVRKAKGRRFAPARARAFRQRIAAQGFRWVHVGGGTWLIPLPGRKRFPCDDTYENVLTGETVIVFTTREAHFEGLAGSCGS